MHSLTTFQRCLISGEALTLRMPIHLAATAHCCRAVAVLPYSFAWVVFGGSTTCQMQHALLFLLHLRIKVSQLRHRYSSEQLYCCV